LADIAKYWLWDESIPGDLNRDGKVNLIDIAVLGQGWQTIYDIYTLADIADYWLLGT
jgi:hypothetical protein